MTFNSDKFELLRYKSKDSKGIQTSTEYISNDGSIIQNSSHVRDLGVILSDNGTCVSIKLKISWVLRTFKSREVTPMLTLWKTLILCHLDYCSQLWSPSKTGNIQALELLQKSFVNRIAGMANLSYWDQLSHLRLYSLERRRERYQIIYTWRIIEKQVPNIDSTPVITQWNPRRGRECRVPPISSSAPSSIKSIRFASLPIKGPRLFNVLPQRIRNLAGCSTDRFKGELDRYLASLPDEPLIPGLTQYRRCCSNSVIDWAKSPYLLQQDTQPRSNTSSELQAAVTL